MPGKAKPASTLTGHTTREQWEKRVKAEKEIKISADEIIPPGTLNERAKAIFEKIVSQGMEASLWDNLDVDSLVRYADGMDRFNQLMESLNNEGVVTYDENGKKHVNACYSAYLKTQDMLMRLSSHLGLTTIDRLKFVTANVRQTQQKKDNKFLELLKNG